MLITHFGVDSSTIFVQQTLGSIHQEVGLKSKSILKTDLVFIFVNFFSGSARDILSPDCNYFSCPIRRI